MAVTAFDLAQMRQRVVVMSGAIADAVAAAVERRQRHQHDVGNDFGGGRRRLENAERPEHQPVVGRPGAKRQRLAARHHRRQRQPRALRGELAHQRRRIDLAADRRVAGDDRAAARSRTAARARRSPAPRPARCSSLNASRAASAAARRSALRWTGRQAADMQRHHVRCHHPRKRVIQYSRALAIEPRSRGVLDTPLSRSTTSRWRDD